MDFSIPPPFPSVLTNPIREPTESDDHPMGESLITQSEDHSMKLGPKPKAIDEDETDALSGLSDVSDTLPDSEKLALALSCRDEGNRKLKEGDLVGAIEMYEEGTLKLKSVVGLEGTEFETSAKEAKVALHLNLSLCRLKQKEWIKAMRAARTALEVDPNNVKGLFRRGVASRNVGFLEEARADLLKACKLEPSNAEARKELALLKQQEEEAKKNDTKAFKGLFSKTSGMYDDRVKQTQEEKIKQEENVKLEMKEYETENKSRESRGEPPIESFEEWQKKKAEQVKKEQQKKREPGATFGGRSSGGAVKPDADFLDEEDRKILDETKKMGYCYFNRKIDDEEKARLDQANKPMRLTESEATEEGQSQKALSSWNSQGTTYEEKDCSTWARQALAERIKSIHVDLCTDREDEERHIHVSKVSPVEGDAQVLVVRASKRYLYDFKFHLTWSLQMCCPHQRDGDSSSSTGVGETIDSDGGAAPADASAPSSPTSSLQTFTGTMMFHDVSSASSGQLSSGESLDNAHRVVDWLKDAKTKTHPPDPPTDLHRSILAKALELLRTEVYKSVKAFEDDFKRFT